MKYTYLSLIFVVLQFMNCTAQKSQTSNMIAEELEWKKEWMDIFFKEYRVYQESDLSKCHDAERNVGYDIERKIRAINQFSFETTLSELNGFLESNQIVYDSLMMKNSHSWHNEEEFNFAPVSFFIYSKSNVRRLVAYLDADRKPTIEEDEENVDNILKYVESLQNGCGYGFTTLTVFNDDLSWWKIKRIVINPSE